jgi:hypothetical protein
MYSVNETKTGLARAFKMLNDIKFFIFVNLYNPNIFQVVNGKLLLWARFIIVNIVLWYIMK